MNSVWKRYSHSDNASIRIVFWRNIHVKELKKKKSCKIRIFLPKVLFRYTFLRALAMRVLDGFGEGGWWRRKSDLVWRRACSCMWRGMWDDFNRTLKLIASEANLMIVWEGLGLGVGVCMRMALEPWISFGSCSSSSSMVMESIWERRKDTFCIKFEVGTG